MELSHVTFAYVAGLLEGIERYAIWKEGKQYVGNNTLLSDAKADLLRALGLSVDDLERIDPARIQVGATLRARLRELGRGALVSPMEAEQAAAIRRDQAQGLRRLAEEASGGGSKPDAPTPPGEIDIRGFGSFNEPQS